MDIDTAAPLVAHDPVAAAIEGHLRNMEEAGHGQFTVSCEGDAIVLVFGRFEVRGETFDLALLRIASALLESVDLCSLFLARMRNPARNPPETNSRDNLLEVR